MSDSSSFNPVQITDGSGDFVAVTPPNTCATVEHPALVVAISPNSPVPVTVTGGATAANQTTLGAQTTSLNDGTRTATIKAASTAPAATDTAIVVAISPNSPIAIGAVGITGDGNTANVTSQGALQVDGSAVTQPVSLAAALPAGGNAIGSVSVSSSSLPAGAATAFNQTTPGAQTTTINVDGETVSSLQGIPLPVSVQGAVSVGATLTPSNGTVQLNVRDESLREGIERTTIAVEALLDYETAKPVPGTISSAPTGVEPGMIVRNIPSGTQSVSVTDGTHGPANVTAASTAAVAANLAQVVALHPSSPVPSGTNTIGTTNQGTAASLANAWSTKITDATNGPAAVKATKTAAATTDPALVVAISPNGPALQGGYDINGNTVTASLVTMNGTVQERVYDETNRLLLEQILLVLIDIRSTLQTSMLKGETVSLSTALDANN